MPTYDYVCDACGHKFELFQSMSEEHKKKCPKCSKNKLRRLIGAGAALMFKGSGFYITDYRSDSYKKKAASENSSSSGDSKPSGGDSKGSSSSGGGGDSSSKSGGKSSGDK